jgi:hypothetical protein
MRKVGTMFFMDIIRINPYLDRVADRLSLLHTDAYRVHCVYNSGTIRSRYAITVWAVWNKIKAIDG